MSSQYTFQIYIVLYPNISFKHTSKMLHSYKYRFNQIYTHFTETVL